MKAKMIDVSWWQKDTVNFRGAKDDGYELVIARASHGFIKDEYFLPNVEKARDADMVVGAYCYLYVDRGMQMIPFIEQTVAAGDIRIRILDVERYSNQDATATQWRNCINSNVKHLEDNGYDVGIYSSIYMWKLCTNDMDTINGKPAEDYMLWTAHWAPVQEPLLPYPWKEWEFWQKGSNLTPSWADGRIDFGEANMTTAELREKYLDEPQPPPPSGLVEQVQRNTKQLELHEERLNIIHEYLESYDGIT